ncbi:hypothetical protein SLEP1_g58835 [Rubroshorea leprosula]|uniref:Transposase n=1 Tax=Rubroshorea leprosula TaxID=152421 RepID=A0AAV5MQN8_9ROSI|nr:hypothetical protein SLEP1_g58835 [Rubroshorea leprosula]
MLEGGREAKLSELYKADRYISRWRKKLEELPFPSFVAKPRSQVSESARAFSKNPAPMGIRPGRPSLSAGASWVLPRSPIRCLDVSYTPRGAKRAYGLALPFDLSSRVTRNAQ